MKPVCLLALSVFLFLACGELELPEETSSSNKDKNTSAGQKDDEDKKADSVTVSLPEIEDEAKDELAQYGENYGLFVNPYRVATFIALDDYTLQTNTRGSFYVKGYIVGYGSGSTIKTGLPEKATSRTNFAIADSPDEQNARQCIAVFLSDKGDDFRSDLNLYDHPENLGRCIIVKASKRSDSYFGNRGIKEPLDFTWAEEE